MANRVHVPAFITCQALFLVWAIFGCLALARVEGDAAAALTTEPSFVVPPRRQLSEPVKREQLGLTCLIPCNLNPFFPTCCAPLCVNLKTDILNCGSCGNKCNVLFNPVCCSGTCTNLLTDPKNCGFCGHDCGSSKCVLGFCKYNGK